MKRFIPTPAMAVALIALAVALSGTAVAAQQALAPANSVGTQSVVNGSIRLVDIAPATVKILKGQTGPQGPQGPSGPQGGPGPQGLTGATGPAGPAGPTGSTGSTGSVGPAGGFNPAKVSVVTGPDLTVGPNEITTTQADCPAGTAVIGGAFFTSGPAVWLSRASGNSWVVGSSPYTSISSTTRAYAICAAP